MGMHKGVPWIYCSTEFEQTLNLSEEAAFILSHPKRGEQQMLSSMRRRNKLLQGVGS